MKKTVMQIAVVAVVVLSTIATVMSAEEAVTISVDRTRIVAASTYSRTPISVIIRIKPNPDNRNLIFEYDAEDGDYSRKDIQLEGENSPKIFNLSDSRYFGTSGVQLPPGHYTLKATLEQAGVKNPPIASIKVNVIVSGEEEEE